MSSNSSKNQSHTLLRQLLYFDSLLYYVYRQDIYALGTIQRNRLGKDCKLPTQKEFMKDSIPRGTFEEHVADYEAVDISVTCWKDNKLVTLASTYVSAEPAGIVKRFDEKEKKSTYHAQK